MVMKRHPRPALLLLAATWLLTTAAKSRDLSRLDELRRDVAARGLDAETIIAPIVIDERMRAFAEEAVAGSGGQTRQRLEALIRHLSDAQSLDLAYVWGHTGTTLEVFERGEANCLAFTNLYIALARSVGLPVYYLLVQGNATFRKEDDLIIVSDHVAVGYGQGPGRLVIDLAAEPEEDPRRLAPISDLTALALFYTNRGAEALRRDEIGTAIEMLRIAVALDPEFAASWINYGVALRRSGELAAAEAAYRRALELDPRARSALANLASLLRLERRTREAEALERVLARQPGKNPFTYLALGDISLSHGRASEAAQLYRRALRLDRRAAEAWAAVGEALLQGGDPAGARRYLRKARQRDPKNPRIERLESALDADG